MEVRLPFALEGERGDLGVLHPRRAGLRWESSEREESRARALGGVGACGAELCCGRIVWVGVVVLGGGAELRWKWWRNES